MKGMSGERLHHIACHTEKGQPSFDLNKLHPNWQAIGADLMHNKVSFLYWSRKRAGGDKLPYINLRREFREPLQDLYERIRIGAGPRKEVVKRGSYTLTRWIYRIEAQLEVFWFLSNVQRFFRGEKRRRVEDALKALEDHLLAASRLRRMAADEALEQHNAPEFEKERQGGYMTRGNWSGAPGKGAGR